MLLAYTANNYQKNTRTYNWQISKNVGSFMWVFTVLLIVCNIVCFREVITNNLTRFPTTIFKVYEWE